MAGESTPPGGQTSDPRGGPLRDLLGETRKSLRFMAVREAVVALAGLLTAALAVATLAARAGLATPILATAELLTVVLAVVAVVIRYGALTRATRNEEDVATWLDRSAAQDPDTSTVGLRSAVELTRDRGRYAESAELADAAVAEAIRRARTIDPEDTVRTAAWPPLRRALIFTATAAGVTTLLAIVMPRAMSEAFAALTAVDQIEEAVAPPPPIPRFSDIRLTYRYPAYTRRTTRTVQSSAGAIRALPGTEVTLETRSRHELAEATLIMTHGDSAEDASRTSVAVDGRQLKAVFVVTRGGRYRFRVRNTRGNILEERRGRPIELELDLPPEVRMTQPDTSPLEVNPDERVPVVYNAEDDFGLAEISIAWRVLGSTRQGQQVLRSASRGGRTFAGKGHFDLVKLKLTAGDRVAYSIEARDNDTVSGPKVGASATQELEVYSKEAHHREVMKKQEKALDELVHVLGDNLERPFAAADEADAFKGVLDAADTVVDRAEKSDALLIDTIAAIHEDPLGKPEIAAAFESARRRLARDTRSQSRALHETRRQFQRTAEANRGQCRRVAGAQKRTVSGLEKNVVYLADLLNDQRLVDAESLLEELRKEQQKLRDALEAYKKAPNEKQRQAILQAIDDIKKRIRELMTEMSRLRKQIPDDFVNNDALRSPADAANMDRIRKMVEEGNVDEAMAELERMLQQTEQMMSSMQSGRQNVGEREYKKVKELGRKLMKQLEKVEKKQREIARKTDTEAERLAERMKERLGDADKLVDKFRQQLDKVKAQTSKAEAAARIQTGGAYDQLMRRIEDTQRALEARDFGAALSMAKLAAQMMDQLNRETRMRAEQAARFGDALGNRQQLDGAVKSLGQADPMLDKVVADLENLMPKPGQMLSKSERKRLDELAKEQKGADQATEQLESLMKELGQELPMGSSGPKEVLKDVRKEMGKSSGGLQQGDAPGAQGPQRKALESLDKFRQALQKMGEGSSGGGGGIPLPFMSPGNGRGNGRGGRGPSSNDKVEIPQPEQYRAPAEFRQEILDAAKEGTVEAYKDAVQRYYEEIIK